MSANKDITIEAGQPRHGWAMYNYARICTKDTSIDTQIFNWPELD